jgi:hypothetical protein
MTREPLWVAINVALGAPDVALPLPVAPMAPAPLVPVVLTPMKLITVMEAGTLCDSVAFMDTPVRAVEANARHISASPF